jgi:hypothetical protein
MMLDEGEETKEVGGKEHFQVLLETWRRVQPRILSTELISSTELILGH